MQNPLNLKHLDFPQEGELLYCGEKIPVRSYGDKVQIGQFVIEWAECYSRSVHVSILNSLSSNNQTMIAIAYRNIFDNDKPKMCTAICNGGFRRAKKEFSFANEKFWRKVYEYMVNENGKDFTL